MKKITGSVAVLLVLTFAGSLAAHHSLALYDTDNAVTVKGKVALFAWSNPHSIIFLDTRGKDGEVHRYAVEGPAPNQLLRIGFPRDTFKTDEVIEVCGFVTKDGANSVKTVDTEPISESLKATTPKSMSGQTMTGALLRMSGGRKQVWSPYGHLDKCLGPDDQDVPRP